jgi:hypothetical protein
MRRVIMYDNEARINYNQPPVKSINYQYDQLFNMPVQNGFSTHATTTTS